MSADAQNGVGERPSEWVALPVHHGAIARCRILCVLPAAVKRIPPTDCRSDLCRDIRSKTVGKGMEQFDTASGRSAPTVHYEMEVYPAHATLSGCSCDCNALTYVSMRALIDKIIRHERSKQVPRSLTGR